MNELRMADCNTLGSLNELAWVHGTRQGLRRPRLTLARALELLGERWTLLIVRDAFYGVRRYGDFLAHLDVPGAVLATRLQAFVGAEVLYRRPYQESPRATSTC